MVKRGPNLTAEQKTTIRMMYHDQGEKPEDIAVYLPQRGVGGLRPPAPRCGFLYKLDPRTYSFHTRQGTG